MLCGIARSQFFSSNLVEDCREFESICKTVLVHESRDPGVQFNEKTEGRKSRDTVPLIGKTEMVSMKISQQENGRKQAEFLKNVAEFLRNWPNFITSLAGRPCCDLATVQATLELPHQKWHSKKELLWGSRSKLEQTALREILLLTGILC
jgi:hypothetical protein